MASLSLRFVLCLALGAVLCGLGGFGVARITESRRWPSLEFTVDKWKAAPPLERYVFWNDLDSRQLLRHKTRDEVLQMLGPPTADEEGGRRLVYVLKGGKGEFLVFLYALDIRFDDRGRVSSTIVVAD